MNSDAKMICRSIDRLTDEARKLRRTMIRNNINAEIDLHEDDEESENRTKTSPLFVGYAQPRGDRWVKCEFPLYYARMGCYDGKKEERNKD